MHITLQEMLDARESRALVQGRMLKAHNAPLICFTMNIAGPVKTSPIVERAFREGVRLINEKLVGHEVIERREEHTKCGPVLFCSLRANADKIKTAMIDIEENHPLGRLFDIDVIADDGRKTTRPTERGCIVCGAPGRACAAGRLHPVSEITSVMDKIMTDYFTDLDAKCIAQIAKESLLREVYTTPKPGLVDMNNNGSHTDMTVADFERSAEALEPYFYECFRLGATHKDQASEKHFPLLREEGIKAEKMMYAATNGANTHKGAIFSMGIIAGAVGRLTSTYGALPTTDDILTEAANIFRPHIERDLESLDGSTAGGRAYLDHGERGIRGEVADGFPSIVNFALPAYKKALAEGKNENDAGVITLLELIANVYDTNLYKRGGDDGLRYAQERAKELIGSGSALENVRLLDDDFIDRRLSPGGCADLLAVTYFLVRTENEKYNS